MKKNHPARWLFSLAILSLPAGAQTLNEANRLHKLQPTRTYLDTVYVGRQKNTYLQIRGVQILAADLGGEPGQLSMAGATPGIIKLRAVKDGFTETNLLVSTSSQCYPFLVRYAEQDETLYIYTPDSTGQAPQHAGDPAGPAPANAGKRISPRFKLASMAFSGTTGPTQDDNDFGWALHHIAQDQHYLYWIFVLRNKSRIDLPVSYLGFEVKQRHAGKTDEAVQSIYPVCLPDPQNAAVIRGESAEMLCLATEKFALRPDEELLVSLLENSRNSKGRQYALRIKARQLRKVITF